MGCMVFATWEDLVEVQPKTMLLMLAAAMEEDVRRRRTANTDDSGTRAGGTGSIATGERERHASESLSRADSISRALSLPKTRSFLARGAARLFGGASGKGDTSSNSVSSSSPPSARKAVAREGGDASSLHSAQL